MHRLIWVFAGRTLILMVLSCRGSFHDVVRSFIQVLNAASPVTEVSCLRQLKLHSTYQTIFATILQETLHADSPKPPATERCDSNLSTSSIDACRICQCDTCEIQIDSPTVSPCLCSGSLKNVHQACLQKWIKSSDKMKCELCMFEYHLTKKTKPVWEVSLGFTVSL